MRRAKPKFKYKILLFPILFLPVVFIVSFYIFQQQSTIGNILVSKIEKKVVYPTLYSDKHITQNAIVTDPQYKDFTFIDKENYFANAISVLKKNKSIIKTNKPENGTWLWTPIVYITPEYRDTIISGAKEKGIKNIYLSIDTYLDIFVMPKGKERDEKKKEFISIIEDFIKTARQNGIDVDAEAGWRNWAEPGNEYKALAVLNFAIQYNNTHTEKFRGFQYDVEPYMLENFEENKKINLKNLVSLVDKSVDALDESDLELSVVVPEFYDGVNDLTPKFKYNGKSRFTIDHLLSVLDRREGSKILVMAYRNFSEGKDGSIDITQNEINSANKSKTKIVVAQEVGDILPEHYTFYNTSHVYYDKQLASIQKAFGNEEGFGGFATHYVNVFLELK